MYKIQIEVPVFSTDANKTRGKHWTNASGTNQKIKSIVRSLTHNKTPEKPLEKFQISITRHGPRALDWDNLVSSFKGYIDALKHVGIIKDDNWTLIKQINTDQKTSTEKKLVITVEEVE